MPPLDTTDFGAVTSMNSCSPLSMCTNRSVATPPEYSHQQRQRKKILGSYAFLGEGPMNRCQSTVCALASGGIGYTHAPSGLLRLFSIRTMLTLPSAPDLMISRALAVMGEVLAPLPTITTLPDFSAAATISFPCSIDQLIGFSTYTCLPAASASRNICRCQWSGVAIVTASISLRARTA